MNLKTLLSKLSMWHSKNNDITIDNHYLLGIINTVSDWLGCPCSPYGTKLYARSTFFFKL